MMRKTTKLLIAVGAVVLGILIGVVAVMQSQSDDIGEDEVRAMIMERYGGEIEAVETRGQHYIVRVSDENFEYEITMEQEDGSITDMKSRELPAEEVAEEPAAENHEGTGEKELMTEEEAKALASEEVGGQFIHVTLDDGAHPAEYQVIQLVEDDDEGALVTIDAQSAEVDKVLWFSIDFEDITDIEAFAQELQEYNRQYQNDYYIEFDDYDDD
ncbi:PepSY domain-containing protein [Salinicoccus bachuensis]|uniref:PepSY domain-containing protein n=1 Tax=Salinicoccus bachuensis TaxID=3136731 RepID=A0ABZ3CIL3_9STAP